MIAGRRASGRPPRATRAARYLAARIASIVVGSALVAGALPALPSDATGILKRVGTLPIGPGDALIPNARTGSVVAVSGGIAPLNVTTFDATTLKRVRRGEYPGLFPQAGSNGRPRIVAFGAGTRTIHLVAYASGLERENFVNPLLVSIDADALALRSTRSLASVFGPGVRLLGLQVRPEGRALIVGQAAPSATVPFLPPAEAPRFAGVAVAEIDLATASVTRAPQIVRGCHAAITNQSQTQLGTFGDRVFVGCATAQVVSVPGPGVPAIAEISLADPQAQQLHFLPGSYATGDVYFDEAAGRLLLVSAAANRPAQSVWVFDLGHRTFVGQVAAGERNLLGFGYNAETGRLYVAINQALLVSLDRGIEIPQATTIDLDTAAGPIVVVPFKRRIVLPVQGANATVVYAVFEDTLPNDAFRPGLPPDLRAFDALTTDEPQYSSDAQAFAARLREIGGVNAALQNVLPLGGNYWRDPGTLTGLKDGNRDITFATVTRAHLGEGEASAEAIAADLDANTASDYQTTARQTSGAISEEWPYEPASCRDFGAGSEPGAATGASVRCALGREILAEAASDAAESVPSLTLPKTELSLGWSYARTTLRRDPGKGLVTHAFAEARDVEIGEAVTIGRVASEATASASGKRGGATAAYRRTFENVRAGGFTCTTDCDPSAVMSAITAALGTQVVVELPTFEAAATPGGAHGHAVREPWAHQQDVAVLSQDPTQQQIPALRIQFVNDSTLASRVILEIAATKADTTMIRLVPPAPPVLDEEPPPAPKPRVLPTLVTRPPPPAPKPAPPGVVERVVRTIGHGWKLLSTGPAGTMARSIALWSLLLSPAFFAARRRWLRRLPGGAA